MSNLRQAAQQALEYMRSVGPNDMWPEEWDIAVALEAALAEPEQPISSVTEAVTKTVIEIEKLLCEKLGRKWQASGIGIEMLINELASRKALAEPEQEPVAWVVYDTDNNDIAWSETGKRLKAETPLYTAPTPRKPQTTHWEGCEAVHPECKEKNT